MERGETGAVLWVFQRGLVPRRDGWLAGRKFATGGIATGAAGRRGVAAIALADWRIRRIAEGSGESYSISFWIVRPSANSRWSIAVGTSHTNLITRRRSSKIRVSHTSWLPSSSILA